MKILSINSGSSSLKFQLFDKTKSLAKGHLDGIAAKSCKFSYKTNKKKIKQTLRIKNHEEAIEIALFTLTESKILKSLNEIDAIGHRVVHGGETYKSPTLINSTVIKKINELANLAPLHNPANLKGIQACKKLLKKTPQVAIFDTAFHQTLDPKAYLYGLPYKYYTTNKIRRYGFHGISHKYVVLKAKKITRSNKKIISCHLGNGSSITATLNGKSIDTSMGFTPLEGIIMGTRSGSLDPALIIHLQKTLKLSAKKIYKLLNEESGLKGISGISHDMRKIYAKSLKKHKRALLSIELLSYQAAKLIGSYTAALNGLDAIVFTGGLGEKAHYVRKQICAYLTHLGLTLDTTANKKNALIISSANSKIAAYVIPTNEEKEIALQTANLLK